MRNIQRQNLIPRATLAVLLTATTLLPATITRADEPAATQPAASGSTTDEAVHNELRALRDKLIDAVNKNDNEAVVALLHPNIVYTAQDTVVCRGREGVRAYFDKMMKGPNRIVDSFKTNANVAELTILYADNNVGVAFGTTSDEFKLTSGLELKLDSKWTATLVKENGKWLIAAFHISGNLFENPIVEMQAKKARIFGAGGLFLGALLMMIAIRLRRRTPENA